jgi:hypothetical protein
MQFLRRLLMRKVLMLCALVAAVAITSIATADTLVITDLESGNPFQAWGVGSWQIRTQQIVTDYTPEIGQTGNWIEAGVGAWGQGMLILPRWGANVWNTWNSDTYNAHSSIGFDAIMFQGQDNMSWPSNTLAFKLGLDCDGQPQVNQNLHFLDLTNLWQTIQLDPEDPDSKITYIKAHFSVPYTDISPVEVPPDGGSFQGYLNFYTTTSDGTLYLDNFTLEGPPLPPVPEPATIVLLAMAGLMGLLYWRKR